MNRPDLLVGKEEEEKGQEGERIEAVDGNTKVNNTEEKKSRPRTWWLKKRTTTRT